MEKSENKKKQLLNEFIDNESVYPKGNDEDSDLLSQNSFEEKETTQSANTNQNFMPIAIHVEKTTSTENPEIRNSSVQDPNERGGNPGMEIISIKAACNMAAINSSTGSGENENKVMITID